MTKTGMQITCSGCGRSTFVEKGKPLGPVKSKFVSYEEGSHTMQYNENQSESWSRTHDVFDLCPICQKIHEEILCKFYEKCAEARDDELYIIPDR